MDKDKLGEWFENKLPEEISYRKCYEVFLLTKGLRPGALVMNPSREAESILEIIADEADLYIKKKSAEKGLSNKVIFLSQDKERLDLLESGGRFYGLTDRSVGKFLGYPESAIDYFIENIGGKSLESRTREKAREMMDLEVFHLEFVCYVPPPEEKSIMEAAKLGKSRYKTLKQSDLGCFFIKKLESEPIYSV